MLVAVSGFLFLNFSGFSIFVGKRSFNFCYLKFSGFSTFMGFQFLDMRSFNSCCLNFSFQLFWVSSFWT